MLIFYKEYNRKEGYYIQMIFLMIDDGHELYKVMMADLFNQEKYEVHEVKKVKMSGFIKKIHDFHYSKRLNKFFELPFKSIWDRWYQLDKYKYIKSEQYTVIFMNGSLKKYYNKKYLYSFKKNHQNVNLCLLLFDKSIYYGARRAIKMHDCFDYVFSFDDDDCKRYGFLRMYSCFSRPNNLFKDSLKYSSVFFVGSGAERLNKLQSCFKKICNDVDDCKFIINDVTTEEQVPIKDVIYNLTIPFQEEMAFAYNSNCLVEIPRDKQVGISLRVCEAVAFNKKLITSNQTIRHLPFYDERYMKIFDNLDDIDTGFIQSKINVKYNDNDFFSPVKILDEIIKINKCNG